jgi:hypothetical protein
MVSVLKRTFGFSSGLFSAKIDGTSDAKTTNTHTSWSYDQNLAVPKSFDIKLCRTNARLKNLFLCSSIEGALFEQKY